MAHDKLWGGRFREPLADVALRFSASIDRDGRLFREDIAGSLVHVEMLAACGIIPAEDAAEIARGLVEIRSEIESGEIAFGPDEEDVHMAIERRLIEKIGPVGGRLHTARSRNDQVALDERLYVRARLDEIMDGITRFQRAIVAQASKHAGTLMPGYTHLQRAQPILLSHHLFAWVAMLERDHERFGECRARMNRSPLGAAALAGTSFPIDREMTARALGFDGIVENSIDAVSDRDYLIELAAHGSILMMHLSRMAEEMVLWASREFRFIRIGDAWTTGSSIMPQKKNPDMAELVRGRTGRVYGALVSLLTTMKALPLAYNRDMQEDKGPMFEVCETLCDSLAVFAGMIEQTEFDRDRLAAEAAMEFSTATELADYLVRAGLPFREAHAVAGNIVHDCVEKGRELHSLRAEDLRRFSPVFGDDIIEYLDPAASVTKKRSAGGSSPAEVQRQIVEWTGRLAARDGR